MKLRALFAPEGSIRYRLQATSLLAVLAGYGVLLLANRQLSEQARRQLHRANVGEVQQQLIRLPANSTPAAAQAVLARLITPGQLVWLEPEPGRSAAAPNLEGLPVLPVPLAQLQQEANRGGKESDRPTSFSLGGRSWLVSRSALAFAGRPAELLVLEDVTDAAERERTTQLLLLAAAGLSSLFTSALLRLVLRRGLRPLDQLSDHLAAITSDTLALERVPLQGQPDELQPIAAAFNDLLQRLADSFEHQRSFVDGVAHELRTPITLISGYAQSLQRQAGGAGMASEPVVRITAEAGRMGRLVADLLDLARDEAGRLEMRRERLDIDEVLLSAYERLQPLAGGRLRLLLPADDLPSLASGDLDRLQHCLTNLVENALKYTPAGSPIELFCSSTETQVIVHVRDHGPGVPEADRQRIFQRFVRASAAASGSGIGLAVVKLLMERMGGEVRVVEAPGGGAEFQLGLQCLTS